MRKLVVSLLAGLVLGSISPVQAQEAFPLVVVNAVELSGDGAIAGNNFNDGAHLAFNEINAAGGILGRQVQVVTLDIQTKAELATAALRKAVDMDAFAVFGPVFSDMVLASMGETQKAGIPTFVGGEAVSITAQGNPFVFRTSLSQAAAIPRLANHLKESLRVQSVAMVTVDNAFGRGGRDVMRQALEAAGIRLAADIVTQPEQRDFAQAVEQVRQADAEAAFVYLNEDEAALCLRELVDQAYGGWIVGETTLMGQTVLDIAREAANGIRGHVGLTPDALVPGIRDFSNDFLAAYGRKSDHNGMKGYIGAYTLKAVAEKAGSTDRAAIAQAMKGLSLSAKDHPGVLLDLRYDDKGDLDRVSFIVRVSNGKHEFVAMLPAAAGSF